MTDQAMRQALKGQYHAGLAMLREAVERFPDLAWLDSTPRNPAWKLAYHALYYTHLYLMPDEAAFRAWEGHAGLPDQDVPEGVAPYARQQALAYLTFCDDLVDGAVDILDLESPACGFHWYAVPKLEHQLINLRHLQQHTGQLQDRLRAVADVGVQWVATGRPGGGRS
jgi:hypothetical protein